MLLLPLLALVTGVELWMTRHDALEAANAPDRSLLGALKSIDANISTASGGLSAELPYSMLEFFELTASGSVVLSRGVVRRAGGLGNADLARWRLEPGVPRFYDATYFGESVRLAAYRRALDSADPHPPCWCGWLKTPVAAGLHRPALCAARCRRDTLVCWPDGAGLRHCWPWRCARWRGWRASADPQRRRHDPLASSDLPADIRPLVDAVNQQMRARKTLVAQQRQFLDDASHQLRTHLTTLQMQIDYARRGATAQVPQHTPAAIGGEIARATRNTQQLLALGHSDTAAVELTPFDLAIAFGGAGAAAPGARQTDRLWHPYARRWHEAVGDGGLLRRA